jgi:hypothetical protein
VLPSIMSGIGLSFVFVPLSIALVMRFVLDRGARHAARRNNFHQAILAAQATHANIAIASLLAHDLAGRAGVRAHAAHLLAPEAPTKRAAHRDSGRMKEHRVRPSRTRITH